MDHKLQAVCEMIADFYLKKNDMDVDKANEEIQKIWITKVEFLTTKCEHCSSESIDKLAIYAVYVGRLIGKRGENIDKLSKFLGYKLHIVEEQTLGYLISHKDYYGDLACHQE